MKLATSKDKIKIKRRAWKVTLPPVKRQKQLPTIDEIEAGKPKQTQTGQTVKPTSKIKNRATSPPRIDETKLITLLINLLSKNWEKEEVLAFLTSMDQKDTPDTSLDLLQILATTFYKANSSDLGDFILAT